MTAQIRVLGELEVTVDGEQRDVGTRANNRLLALLVAVLPEGVSFDAAADQLWGLADRPEDPERTLRTYVSRLRRVLGPERVVVSGGVMRLHDVDIDAIRFEDLVVRARRARESPTAGELWGESIAQWRGPAFAGHDDLLSVQPVAVRLGELRSEAMEAWFDRRLASGESRELVADLGSAINEFPLREGFRIQRMTVLAGGGRQADALREFQRFRGALTEIGLEPSSEIVELEQRIVAGEALGPPRLTAAIRDYRMRDRLGEGAFSVVYRAEQTSVGRDVAVKQIRAELANRPEFIRQFEAEAHLVASLEHPHIVPLFDYWREPGSAYLVMRYLRGGSLGSQIVDSPMDVTKVAQIMLDVGGALDEAHRRGVVHRDIKPDNVLLDDEGRGYLSDFGIAVDEIQAADPEVWMSHGSPAYASPEQLRREPVGPASDVHGLGVAAFEALTGRLPFPDETTMAGLLDRQLNEPIPLVSAIRHDVPPSIDRVLQQATAKDPATRHDSAGEFARAFASAAGLPVMVDTPVDDRNPYKGLLAYTEADAGDFVGRDRLVQQLVEAVAAHRVVTVVGPSGSGKSSVVRAGLIPALRQGRVTGSSRWWVTTMTPGDDPFGSLAEALSRVAVTPPPELATHLASDPKRLRKELWDLVPADRELVVVIDQLEELFTLSPERDRHKFLDTIGEAASEVGNRFRVVLTLRADFYDRPLRYPSFARLIEPGTVAVHPLAGDELEQVITLPAQRVGTRFEPGIVARITADVSDQPGALPLLQYTLTQLHDKRNDHNLITDAAYRELGGVSGALASRADELYSKGSEVERDATRRLFARLVSLGEGTGDTRRRLRSSEILGDAAVGTVVARFGDARLLAFDQDDATREPTIEVAHEALIREWPRLRTWVDDDRDNLRLLRHLTESAAQWDRSGRGDADLYRGARLASAREFEAHRAGELSELEQEFLAASQARDEAERRHERRQMVRLRRSLIAVAAVALLALLAGGLAFSQKRRADTEAATAQENAAAAQQAASEARDARSLEAEQRQRADAEAASAQQSASAAQAAASEAESARELEAGARERAELSTLAARSTVEAGKRPSLALLLAVEAYDRDPGVTAQTALLAALDAIPYREAAFSIGLSQPGSSNCVTAVGRRGFVVHLPDSLGIADVAAREVRGLDVDAPCEVAVSHDLSMLAAPQGDGNVIVWNIESNTRISELVITDGVPNRMSFSPDGSELLVGLGASTVSDLVERQLLVDTRSGNVLRDVVLDRPVSQMSWAPTGELAVHVVTEPGPDRVGELVLTQGPGGDEIGRIDGVVGSNSEVQWAERGNLLWVGDGSFTDYIIDRTTATLLSTAVAVNDEGHHFGRLSPDGSYVLSQLDSGLYLHDPATGELVGRPVNLAGLGREGLFIDDDTVAIVQDNGMIEIVDFTLAGGVASQSVLCCEDLGFVGLSPDDRLIVVRPVAAQDMFRLVDPSAGASRDVLYEDVDLDPRQTLGALSVGDGEVQVFGRDLSATVVDRNGTRVGAIDYADDRNLQILSLARNGALVMFLVADLDESDPAGAAPGKPQFIIVDMHRRETVGEPWPYDVSDPNVPTGWMPLTNGDVVFVSENGLIRRVGPDGTAVVSREMVAGSRILASQSKAGETVAILAPDETIDILDTDGLESKATIASTGAFSILIFEELGKSIITTNSGEHILYDLDSGETIGALVTGGVGRPSGATVPSSDGTSAWVVAGVDQLIRVSLDPQDWRDRACELAGRGITPEEWNDFVPGSRPYRPVCAQAQ